MQGPGAVRRLLAAAAFLLVPALSSGKVLLTFQEALGLAFPGCEVERESLFLTDEQVERARRLAGVEVPSALVTRFVARETGRAVGWAYLDTHRVRTLPETLLIVVDPKSRVARVEVLSFAEPEEYLPRDAWYAQLLGRPLDDDLRLKRAIRPVTGATLTARATEAAVRRVLAVHQVAGSDQ